ncbi:MAG: hypothetical protein II336_18010 [Loktanella sp.]|nr:hypothetical protein [Loktanella sp.]
MAGSEGKICAHCGSRFERRSRMSDAQWAGRKYCCKPCADARPAARDAKIVAMYADNKSSLQISEAIGISAVHVIRVLRSCGVKVRTFVEAEKINQNRLKSRAEKPQFACKNNGFVIKSSNQQGAWNRPADLSIQSHRRA